MKIFGIPIMIDFSTKTVDKQERYEELSREVNTFMDDESGPRSGPEYEAWKAKMHESVDLFNALVEEGAMSTEYEPAQAPEPETEKPWFKFW